MSNKSNKSDRKEGYIMSRINTKPKKDRQIFKRTAASTKKINVSPRVMRGGTRL